ncbi:MAG: ATP-binding protein, partial [Pseudomonadota bacterium]
SGPGPLGSRMSARWGFGTPLPYTPIIGQWEHREYSVGARGFGPKALAVLVGNLVRNACAYTEQGTIDITITENGLCIQDSGVGIPAGEMSKVFEAHYRGQRRSDSTGHGVGLTIVKRFSDRFRWPLRIDSDVGKGTRVEVKFPDAVVSPLR